MSSWNDVLGSGIPKGGEQPLAVRKEIRDLTSVEQYLFAEGLARFQQKDIDKPKQAPDSYYEIAGIHGAPYRRWPNEDFNKDIGTDVGQDGFCTHSSILFLTWHRPFLALFEAKLYEHVAAIAAGISAEDGKDRYVAAAKTFRLPYWDWARVDRDAFPQEAIGNNIWWTGPQSTDSVWPEGRKYNPLHHAPLPSNSDSNVLRYGNPTIRQSAVNAQRRESTLWNAVQRFHDNASLGIIGVGPQQRNLSERVANILGAYQRFSPVCNNKYSIDGLSNREFNDKTSAQQRDILSRRTARSETWGSLEDIHNTVHGIVGNGGHMGQIESSAFDPIFWLHHCNIDRLFALWQGLREDPKNKDTWVTDQNASWTFMRQDLQEPDGDSTPLYPFKYVDARDGSLNWYTSAQTHNIEDFNYTYEELSGLQSLTLAARRGKLIPVIGALYPQPGDDISASVANIETAGARMLPQARMIQTFAQEPIAATVSQALEVVAALPEPQVLLQESLQPEKPFLRDLADNDGKFLDWIVNVKGEKHAFDGKYAVYIFLGPVQEDDVELWPISPHFVGLLAPLGQSTATGCGKCQQAQREQVEVTGQVPLTVALMERYIAQLIPDLTVDTVVPYLQKNLHWRVAVDHQALDDRSQVPGLTVFVVSNEVTATQPVDELPIFADDVVIHAQATTNLNGEGRGNGTGLAVGEEGTQRTTSS